MAVAGAWHPQLVVSQSVMNALSEEQKQAAFRHEAAHRTSRDNLKKLLFLLSPDVLPFVSGLSELGTRLGQFHGMGCRRRGSRRQSGARAVASVGTGTCRQTGRTSRTVIFLSSLVDDDCDLETRVDRLLREPAYAEKPLQPVVAFTRNAALVLARSRCHHIAVA